MSGCRMSGCPVPEQLRRLLAEQLSGPEAAALEAHVQTCAACQQALEGLTAATGAWAGRGADPAGEQTAFLQRLSASPPPPSGGPETVVAEGGPGVGEGAGTPSIPGHE